MALRTINSTERRQKDGIWVWPVYPCFRKATGQEWELHEMKISTELKHLICSQFTTHITRMRCICTYVHIYYVHLTENETKPLSDAWTPFMWSKWGWRRVWGGVGIGVLVGWWCCVNEIKIKLWCLPGRINCVSPKGYGCAAVRSRMFSVGQRQWKGVGN